ncbi:MAG: anaerobic ribonucleoside-triphosphate reductase [Clostridiaceae bacterium]
MSSYDKIGIEGPFHKFCNAGHISYVEMSSPPINNPKAVESIIRCMIENDMGYGAINYTVDFTRRIKIKIYFFVVYRRKI